MQAGIQSAPRAQKKGILAGLGGGMSVLTRHDTRPDCAEGAGEAGGMVARQAFGVALDRPC